jgi:predicted dehydrogenase
MYFGIFWLFLIVRANAHADAANSAPANVLVCFHMLGAFLCIEYFFSLVTGYVFLARDSARGAGIAADGTHTAFRGFDFAGGFERHIRQHRSQAHERPVFLCYKHTAFTDKSKSGGGVLIDWGIHLLDLILFVLGGATISNVTCDTFCEMARDMKSYRYNRMWAEDTKDVENGVNDVDDPVSGYVRTDKAAISFNGAWAENINAENSMFVDFMGDKGGARLTYGGQFSFFDGETLETSVSDHEIPNMYLCEDEDFILSTKTGEKNRNHIDNILESMKLLDALYASAQQKSEVRF